MTGPAEDVRTVRDRVEPAPIRTLRVDVVEGLDAGQVRFADGETFSVGTAEGNDLVLTDTTVSRYHVELSRTVDGIGITDLGSTNGTRVGAARIERAAVPPGTVVRVGRTALRIADGETRAIEVVEGDALGPLRGRSPIMRRLMARVRRASQAQAALLLIGETGTGKELVARAVHDLGPRAAGPFVTVDCGAVPPSLLASEIFGHERGAFTGADRPREGAFERAHGGTLFLDEIGELPADQQAALLGVLERRRFQRLGGRTEIAVDVRVVGATNRDLRAEVNAGSFRPDLYYRLAVVVIHVPALRERLEDVPLLVEHFVRQLGHDEPVAEILPASLVAALANHRWPGNVRELRNLVEAALAMGEVPELEPSQAPAAREGLAPDASFAPLLDLPYREARATLLGRFEGVYLQSLLERCRGNVSRAAREARMDRSHLVDLLRRHDLKR